MSAYFHCSLHHQTQGYIGSDPTDTDPSHYTLRDSSGSCLLTRRPGRTLPVHLHHHCTKTGTSVQAPESGLLLFSPVTVWKENNQLIKILHFLNIFYSFAYIELIYKEIENVFYLKYCS